MTESLAEKLNRIADELSGLRDVVDTEVESAVDRMTNEQARQLLAAQQRAVEAQAVRDRLLPRIKELETDLANALEGERRADSRADDFHTSMEVARRETADRDERIRVLETDLRNASRRGDTYVEQLEIAKRRATELEDRLTEYENGEMKIGPDYQEMVDRLQNYVEDTGPVDILEVLRDVKELLGAIRQLDSLSRHRYGRIGSLQASLDAEKVRTENASRRANTAERLMREAQATATEALASVAHFKNELEFAGEREQELRESLTASEAKAGDLFDEAIRLKQKARGLDAAVQNINEVATRTAELLIGSGSGIRAGMEVRREMLLKYSLEHDAEHGADMFDEAASALLTGARADWPDAWERATFYTLLDNPQRARAHAIALIAVAYDITRKEQDET